MSIYLIVNGKYCVLKTVHVDALKVEMAVDLSKLYGRDFELSSGVELNFLQSETGDVGCVVWDAALVLCAYLDHCQRKGLLNLGHQTVLELGAGTGAVGLVAATLG